MKLAASLTKFSVRITSRDMKRKSRRLRSRNGSGRVCGDIADDIPPRDKRPEPARFGSRWGGENVRSYRALPSSLRPPFAVPANDKKQPSDIANPYQVP